MTPSALSAVSHQLVTAMKSLLALHEQLAKAVDEQIERMRAGDSSGLEQCNRRLHDLIAKVGQQESVRRSLAARVARGYGMNPQSAAKLRASELSKRLPASLGQQLQQVADRLRAILDRIEQRNRVAKQISTCMVGHLHQVLDAMTAVPVREQGYAPGGSTCGSPRRLFETVG